MLPKHLFENRTKHFARLSEAADYIGRRLRQNLIIYDMDSKENKVTFVTEKQNFIRCDYEFIKGNLTLSKFIVESLDEVMSDEAVDKQVSVEISSFIDSLQTDNYTDAEHTFSNLIESFETRAKIEDARKKLVRKIEKFGEAYNIRETKSFKKFIEVFPLFVNFLKENKKEIENSDMLAESLRLCVTVEQVYNLPPLKQSNLAESVIVIPNNFNKTLYEIICNNELIKHELIESKTSFSKMWVNNEDISRLASNIFSTDSKIKTALKECVVKIPYLALATKVELETLFESVFSMSNPGTISPKDISVFISQIFEFKKPLKAVVIKTLNEEYGVNVQSLKFVPSFRGLAEAQAEIFTTISDMCDEGILRDVLVEFAQKLTSKGGVQVLDVCNLLAEALRRGDVEIVPSKTGYLNGSVFKDLGEFIKEAGLYGDEDTLSNTDGKKNDRKLTKKKKVDMGDEGDGEDEEGKGTKGKKNPFKKKGSEDEGDEGDSEDDEKGKKNPFQKKGGKPGDKKASDEKDPNAKEEKGDKKKPAFLKKEGLAAKEMETDENEGNEIEEDEDEDGLEEGEPTVADLEAQNLEFTQLFSKIAGVLDQMDLNLPEEEEDDLAVGGEEGDEL